MHYASFFHYLVFELWTPGWANILMPSVWTLVGLLLADIRHARRQRVHHAENKSVITDLAGQIEALSDKLKAMTGGSNDDED